MKDNRDSGDIASKLAAVRTQKAISAASLAAAVGVSRQTIYALEAGAYTPNTAVALRLARALGVTVEDLFELPQAKSRPRTVTPIAKDVAPGQPVQLCQVDDKLIAIPSAPEAWYLPASDGVLTDKTRVDLDGSEPDFSNRLLFAGCDPAMAVLARYLQPCGIDLVLTHQNSSQSLALLKQGRVHIAGTHLRSNDAAIAKLFPGSAVTLISFALGEEGLLTASGNPRNIKGLQDLAREDVTLINREPGSGSRTLLDRHLKRLHLDTERVNGYHLTAPGHLAAAWEVKTGRADCCIATHSAARVLGLCFIPLESVRYDLAVQKRHLKLPAMQTLFDVVNRAKFRQALHRAGGYDTSVTGARVR
jgi:molybdate-binding protein/DNA-binding XRE family transcriptional regulator